MLEIPTPGGEPLAIRDTAHGQLAERVGIPKAYYDRMREHAPALFDTNVNHWLLASDGRRLVRTLDGHARAILSDRYRMLDNDDLAAVALPVLRPLRLLRLITVLKVLNRRAGATLRGRVAIYLVTSTGLVVFVAALAMLEAERPAPEANVRTFGDAYGSTPSSAGDAVVIGATSSNGRWIIP